MLTSSGKTRPWYGLVHLACYQGTWATALWGGSVGLTWPGVAAAIGTLVVHLSFTSPTKLLLLRLFIATCLGVVLDGLLIATGVIVFPTDSILLPFLPPLWMIVLWPTFAALFDDIMHWLLPHMTWAIGAGLIAGPLAYIGGQAFGALTLPLNWWITFFSIGLAWAVAMALLVLIWRYPGARS